MKKLIALSFLFTTLLFTNNTYAKIWRVNNTPGVAADFTTVQAAHDAAVAGDTIHVEQGSYGALTMTKPLVVIGSGYFLSGANGNTGLQANSAVESSLNSVSFNAGSSGAVVTGCNISTTYIYASNITLKRNYLYSWVYLYGGANNLTINGNYFYYGITQGGYSQTGLSITNNIFTAYGVSLDAGSTGVFENNTLIGGSLNLYNFQIDNNILSSVSFTANNSVYFNNISSSANIGSANGNIPSVTMINNVFVASGTTDGQYQLKAGSPAIGAGYGGVDMGAFGNVNPYKLSGIPSVPTIYSLTVPPTGTTNINVTISTKSNN